MILYYQYITITNLIVERIDTHRDIIFNISVLHFECWMDLCSRPDIRNRALGPLDMHLLLKVLILDTPRILQILQNVERY